VGGSHASFNGFHRAARLRRWAGRKPATFKIVDVGGAIHQIAAALAAPENLDRQPS
jgi:hypothetical protein